LSKTVVHENPLVPNAKLRQMYVAMAEVRALDEHIVGLQRRVKRPRKLESTRGQEACRVSMAIDLTAGDMVIDSQPGVVMDLIAGEKVASLLKRVGEFHSGKKGKGAKGRMGAGRLLPWIEDSGDRLKMAMGAALSFKIEGRKNVVVVFVRQGEAGKAVWRQVLGLAGRFELPVIFVILPAARGEKTRWNLSAKASGWGVPGMPVDAGDAVALYRVAQESLGRTRAGDGAVLVECVSFRAGSGNPVDPLVQMKEFLLDRKVCTKAWLEGPGERLRKRIAGAQ
jgi:TPP-dependent pyruvate/acetoin dehydrogenase alpha subunit